MLREHADVSLGVDAVVIVPIGDRAARKASLEILGILEHSVQSHMPAIAPAPDSQAVGIDEGQRFQILGAITLVGKLLSAEAIANGLLEEMAASRRSAIIEREDAGPLLRHH